jgi:hypothetical protein
VADRDYSALAVSQALDTGQLTLEGRAFSRSALAAAGIGPSGRYIDGAPIVPVRIRPQEALRRGGKELEGFWPVFEFPEERWARNGGPALFAAHLDFLRSFGISGGIAAEREEGAGLLAAYLASLGGKIEDGRALALVPAGYYEDCLRRYLSPALPVGASEGVSLFDPRFRGAGIALYEALLGNLAILKPRFDILILAEPETALLRLPLIRAINARVILGVFTGAEDLLTPGPHPLKGLFSLRGGMAELAGYCVRRLREDLPLPPRYQFEQKPLRRPPRPFSRSEAPDLSAFGFPGRTGSGGGWRPGGPDAPGGGFEDRLIIAGGGRFIMQYRFKNIGTPEYAEERAFFFDKGRRTSRELCPPDQDYDLSFADLSGKQRAYFLYWRDSLRNGRSLETCAAYIALYARELILCLGGGAEENFRELFRLWRSCRENFPGLNGLFPRWLLDFAVLYKRMDLLSEEVLPVTDGTHPAILRDLALHLRHIENDGPINFGDVQLMLYHELASSRFYTSLYGPLLEIYAERALNALDRLLGIFNSFYPARTRPVLFEAFPRLRGLGQSSYSAEWIRLSDHPPLKALFRSVAAYVEYQLRRQTAFPGILRKAGIDPVWKEVIDAELGFPGEAAVKPIRLEDHKLDQIRDESDAVRELLRMEEDGLQNGAEPPEEPVPVPLPQRRLPPAEPESAAMPGEAVREGSASALAAFLAELPAAEQEILACIVRGAAAGDLRELALKYGSMPELLADSLNAAFQETFGDLLVETLDEGPAVSAEYEAEVKRFFES